MSAPIDRRHALGLLGLSALAGSLSPGGALESNAAHGQAPAVDAPARSRRRSLRIAHLTDIHVQPERAAGDGMAACLDHVMALPDRPELVLTGGDLIMDGFAARAARTEQQWDLWTSVLRDHCDLPVEHCLGNHDIWGWDKSGSATTGDEARWGKQWAMEVLGLPRPYRSFDRAGWHFVVLDSVSPNGDGYVGRLDADQLAWLDEDLGRVPAGRPALVVSHIPILSVTTLLSDNALKSGKWTVDASLLHADGNAIRRVFARHGNVRLCLSGHTHRNDRVDVDGVAYICDGAVSGNWWKGGAGQQGGGHAREGYGVVDLNQNGTFEHEYVEFGWKAQA